jgi:predicted patatin/cPLA2 family phospholipase
MSATHPVAQLLYQRRNEGSLPGARTDGCRVGLVVEGGGMRGIISAAMMATLIDYGLENSFDAVYAISAGAFNSVYFLAGVGWYALSIYYDSLLSKAFFDIRRLLRGQPAISLEYVINEVMEKVKPLDYASVLASPIELHIVTSSIHTLQPHVFTGFASKENLKIVLKASACLPLVAGFPIAYASDSLLDGDFLLNHPILPALDNNCTHILFLRTYIESPFRIATLARQYLTAGCLQYIRPGLGTAYLNTTRRYRQLQRHFQEVGTQQDTPPFILEVACPAEAHTPTLFSQDRGALLQGLFAGHQAMLKAIDHESDNHVYQPPTLFTHP